VNFNYIQNVNEEVAEIRIYKRIGASLEQDGVNGSDFANEMAWLQDKCKKINVRILQEIFKFSIYTQTLTHDLIYAMLNILCLFFFSLQKTN
jgi:hypothetical protein